MKAIYIDFAPRSPVQVIASMWPAHWLLLSIGFAMSVGGMVASHNLTQQQSVRLAELEQIQFKAKERSTPAANSRKPAIPEEQAIAINSAIQQLNLPWGHLLTAIERATPSNVALLELVPNAKKHFVNGTAETKSKGMMLAYISRLKQQPFLGNVVLTKHEISEQDSNRPLRFEFEAEWLEAGR